MPKAKAIPLDDLNTYEKEKLDSMNRGLDSKLYPTPKYITRRLVLNLLTEATLSLIVYYNYDFLLNYHRLLAPSILGASTAMMAQSINQFFKSKLSYNKICKFLVWGLINGAFTVLWFDFIIVKFESITYRILVDQMVGAPSFQLVFNILNSLWDHGEITSNTRAVYIKSLKYSYCFWPFFSIVGFMFIPEAFLFPANCLANLLWSLILARIG